MNIDLHGATHALTIRSPWALAIMLGAKRYENRTWLPRVVCVGDRIAIHVSAAKPTNKLMGEVFGPTHRSVEPGWAPGLVDMLAWMRKCDDVRGLVLGTVEIVGMHRAPIDDPWWLGPCAIEVADPRPLDARVLAKGRLGCWPIDGRITEVRT